jgi:OmpA-OmpF porin, OOP family
MATERTDELGDDAALRDEPGPHRAVARDPAADPWRWRLVAVLAIAGLSDYVALNVAVLPRCFEARGPQVAAAAPSRTRARRAVVPAVEPSRAAPRRAPRHAPAAAPTAAREPAPGRGEAVGDALPNVEDLHFVTNSSALLDDGVATAERVATILARTPGQRVHLRGHADERGELDANQRLSERRAAAVAAFLRRRGISLDRIDIEGVGEHMPADQSGTPEARARNRRVEVLWR